MTFALIVGNTVQALGRLPESARRLDDGSLVIGLADATRELREATGWFEVVDTTRPTDTAEATYDRSIALVSGVPTVVWTERAKTADELAGQQQQANRTTVQDRLRADLATIDAIVGTAAVSVTGSTVAEVRSSTQAALRDLQRQTKDVARIAKRLIRAELQAYDSAD